jgi:hypothetical protein
VTITESRVINGTLKLGPTATALDMSCQLTNVLINSAYEDDGNAVTTLCGDSKPAPRKLTGRTLDGTFIQDFDDPDGVVSYVWDNDLQVVSFEFVPDDATTGPTLAGEVMLEVPQNTYGGDVASRLTSDFSWNIQGDVTRTYPAGP